MTIFLGIILVLSALWWLAGVIVYYGYRSNFAVHIAYGSMYHTAQLLGIAKSCRRAFLTALISGGLLIYFW